MTWHCYSGIQFVQFLPDVFQMLPHPSFVYCGQFHPSNGSALVTGCYDHVVRVWNRAHRSSRFEVRHAGVHTVSLVSTTPALYYRKYTNTSMESSRV